MILTISSVFQGGPNFLRFSHWPGIETAQLPHYQSQLGPFLGRAERKASYPANISAANFPNEVQRIISFGLSNALIMYTS
jgi:hypothetical protein